MMAAQTSPPVTRIDRNVKGKSMDDSWSWDSGLSIESAPPYSLLMGGEGGSPRFCKFSSFCWSFSVYWLNGSVCCAPPVTCWGWRGERAPPIQNRHIEALRWFCWSTKSVPPAAPAVVVACCCQVTRFAVRIVADLLKNTRNKNVQFDFKSRDRSWNDSFGQGGVALGPIKAA